MASEFLCKICGATYRGESTKTVCDVCSKQYPGAKTLEEAKGEIKPIAANEVVFGDARLDKKITEIVNKILDERLKVKKETK